MKLSFIIPTLNEAEYIGACLLPLQSLRKKGHQVIVADGGSTDETAAIAATLADHVVTCPSGRRAMQMNKGARLAVGDVLVFLHADTLLPEDVDHYLLNGVNIGRGWGRFDVRLSGNGPALRIIEWFMNVRSRLTGIATGDQAIFVTQGLFEESGGYPDIAIMEDIAFSKILKKRMPPVCLRKKVVASSRRWEKFGVIRTVLQMWMLRARYFLGADPDNLARQYEYQK